MDFLRDLKGPTYNQLDAWETAELARAIEAYQQQQQIENSPVQEDFQAQRSTLGVMQSQLRPQSAFSLQKNL